MPLLRRLLASLVTFVLALVSAGDLGRNTVTDQPEGYERLVDGGSPGEMYAITPETPPVSFSPPDPEPVPVTTTTAAQVAAPRSRCGDDFDCFRACTIQIESHGQYDINTGNGHYGAWQFAHGTWVGAVTRAGYPEWSERTADQAPPSVQDAAAHQLWLERGTQPWGYRCQ